MLRIPFDPAKMPKICKDCKHFISPPPNYQKRFGLCKKGGTIDLIDGSIVYEYASSMRADKCRGTLWEPNSSTIKK